MYRAHEGRLELKVPCRLRRQRQTIGHAAQRGADERLQRRGADAGRLAQSQSLARHRSYDADWFRAALAERKIIACIPSKKNRKVPIPRDTALYRQRHKVEIMFGRLKGWRRIHTCYDRCAHTSCPPSLSPPPSSSGSDQ
jgi:transposase